MSLPGRHPDRTKGGFQCGHVICPRAARASGMPLHGGQVFRLAQNNTSLRAAQQLIAGETDHVCPLCQAVPYGGLITQAIGRQWQQRPLPRSCSIGRLCWRASSDSCVMLTDWVNLQSGNCCNAPSSKRSGLFANGAFVVRQAGFVSGANFHQRAAALRHHIRHRKEPPISTSSPRETMTSCPFASVDKQAAWRLRCC